MTYSTFLFARPSFWEGIARIFDFGNTLQEYNTVLTPESSDYLALLADWYAVGDDMRIVINNTNQKPSSNKNDQEL
ncbi:MAG: hypothetical protein GXP38_14445 [Chloroflexi bacterium]|nr:hypothetical protein [Chloroflexota bacterium]